MTNKAPAATTNTRRTGMKTPMIYYAGLVVFSLVVLSIGSAAGLH